MNKLPVLDNIFSDKLYFSVFQKYNFNSLSRFFILCSDSDLWQLSGTISIFIILIGLVLYFWFQAQQKSLTTSESEEQFEEEKSSEDSTDSEEQFEEEESSKDSTDSEEQFEEEESSKDSTDSEEQFEEEESSKDSTDSEEVLFSRNITNFFGDLVFERVLAHIVNQVDDWTFRARFCESNLIVNCYLGPELYSDLARPLVGVGSLVRLQYNYYPFGSKDYGYYIVQVINSKVIKEDAPWRWNGVYGEVIEEYQYQKEDDRIIYTRILESGEVVPCKVFDHLRDTIIEKDSLVYLEVNERNKTYFIYEIVERSDSGGIP